jgi:hypothetical protein
MFFPLRTHKRRIYITIISKKALGSMVSKCRELDLKKILLYTSTTPILVFW